jgi:hypothetical protein
MAASAKFRGIEITYAVLLRMQQCASWLPIANHRPIATELNATETDFA